MKVKATYLIAYKCTVSKASYNSKEADSFIIDSVLISSEKELLKTEEFPTLIEFARNHELSKYFNNERNPYDFEIKILAITKLK